MKDKYTSKPQLAVLMYFNYGISLEDFTKLVNEKYEDVPSSDIIEVHERLSKIKRFHVIETDNYNGDYPDEHALGFIDHAGDSHSLVFNTKEDAQVIANAFNQIKYQGDNRYFMVVEITRKLQGPFEP